MRRMHRTLRLLLKSLLLLVATNSLAQTSGDQNCKPPKSHELWHDRIEAEQKNALKADGYPDSKFHAGGNEDVNYYITLALTKKIDQLQCDIEKDTTTKDQQKVAYLQGLANLLRNFTNQYRILQFSASHFPIALQVYEEAVNRDKKK